MQIATFFPQYSISASYNEVTSSARWCQEVVGVFLDGSPSFFELYAVTVWNSFRPFCACSYSINLVGLLLLHSSESTSESCIAPSLRLTAESLRQDMTDQSFCAASRHVYLESIHDWLLIPVQIDTESVDFFC